jgi:hypothetical protein
MAHSSMLVAHGDCRTSGGPMVLEPPPPGLPWGSMSREVMWWSDFSRVPLLGPSSLSSMSFEWADLVWVNEAAMLDSAFHNLKFDFASFLRTF